MKVILLLLQALMLDPDVTMPPPDKYQDLYCAYYLHPICKNVEEGATDTTPEMSA